MLHASQWHGASAIETDLQPLYGQASNVIFSWHVRVVDVAATRSATRYITTLHNQIALLGGQEQFKFRPSTELLNSIRNTPNLCSTCISNCKPRPQAICNASHILCTYQILKGEINVQVMRTFSICLRLCVCVGGGGGWQRMHCSL